MGSGIHLFNADCMEGMKIISDQEFDLAIVDPPYYSGPEKRKYYGSKNPKTGAARLYKTSGKQWNVPDESYFRELTRVAKHYIVWGCNYFDWRFAPGRIVWDKCNGSNTFSDAEIAATDLQRTVTLFSYMWSGMFQGKSIAEGRTQQGNKALNEERIHPTQKPVALYMWLLQRYAKPGMKILDTHAGSGSCLIACHRCGFECVGFEIDPNYYRDAMTRIDMEIRQVSIFDGEDYAL